MEIVPHQDPVQAAIGNIWRYHDNINFDGFCQQFRVNPDNAQAYPILAAVIENEVMLPKIKYITDILAWQAIVFKVSFGCSTRSFSCGNNLGVYTTQVCKVGSLTRDEASNISNMDIVNRLPEDERADALSVLRNFCVAFNETIILDGNLLGCADNIFKTNDLIPMPDLSAKKSAVPVPMSEDASIAFALPSSTMEADNLFKDPRSLCTIYIINRLKVILFSLCVV
jgi:hypothetical protein